MSLGAGPLLTFRRVTFPLIRAGVLSGAVFAFIHSFDEVIITMFISGVHVQTLPLEVGRFATRLIRRSPPCPRCCSCCRSCGSSCSRWRKGCTGRLALSAASR